MRHWLFYVTKTILPSGVLLAFCFVLTGLIYPGIVTLILQVGANDTANGSQMNVAGLVKGSYLVAQNFEPREYFKGRGSFAQQADRADVPKLLLQPSASGLDPHLFVEAALFQVPQIAFARGIPEADVKKIVMDHVEKPLWGFWGSEMVNLNRLNLALGATVK